MKKNFIIDILICAKENSKGLYKKNTKLLKGKPMICWTFEQANKIKKIRNIYVSTDSTYIKKLAIEHSIKVPYMRPKNLCVSKSREWDVWKYHLNKIYKDSENIAPNAILILPATCPNRNLQDVQGVINKFKKSKFDAMVTVTESKEFPYFNFVKKKNSKNSEIVKFSKEKFYNRQEVPKTYTIAPSVYIIKVSHLSKNNHFYDGNVGSHEISYLNSLDVDNEIDFKILDLFFKHK